MDFVPEIILISKIATLSLFAMITTVVGLNLSIFAMLFASMLLQLTHLAGESVTELRFLAKCLYYSYAIVFHFFIIEKKKRVSSWFFIALFAVLSILAVAFKMINFHFHSIAQYLEIIGATMTVLVIFLLCFRFFKDKVILLIIIIDEYRGMIKIVIMIKLGYTW